jgi:hypothetical protein
VRAADARLKELARLDGTPVDEAFRAERTRRLLDLFEAEQPDVLLTEQFPFGRTQLRFELLPLLEAAQDRAVGAVDRFVGARRAAALGVAGEGRRDGGDVRGLRRGAGPCRSGAGAARRELSPPGPTSRPARSTRATSTEIDPDACPVGDVAVGHGRGDRVGGRRGGRCMPLLQAALAARPLTGAGRPQMAPAGRAERA